MKASRRPLRGLIAAIAPWILMATGASCSGGPNDTLVDTMGTSSRRAIVATDAASSSNSTSGCDLPAEGCSCESPGGTTACKGPTVRNGSYEYCLTGYRLCSSGTWGPCVLPKVY